MKAREGGGREGRERREDGGGWFGTLVVWYRAAVGLDALEVSLRELREVRERLGRWRGMFSNLEREMRCHKARGEIKLCLWAVFANIWIE